MSGPAASPGRVLHVTNGDSAVQALRAGGMDGQMLPWRDVLHDGPVPAGLGDAELAEVRARFIAAQGWAAEAEALRGIAGRDATLARQGAFAEVVLWFEHDLYDQLQLIQVLDRLARHPLAGTRVTLVNPAEYLGPASPDRIATLFAERQPVAAAQLALAMEAWDAFRADDPRRVEAVIAGGTVQLAHLGAALRRHLQQLPSTRNGLSRSEQQALEAVAAGAATPADAYRASHQELEDPVWLGDWSFAAYLAALARGPSPLLAFGDGSPIAPPRHDDPADGFWTRPLALTDAGREVMDGRADHVRLNGIDRWLGGVHLAGRGVRWRWDEAAGRIADG